MTPAQARAFETLGSDQNDNLAQLAAKYRKLALQYHPDRNPHISNDDAQARMLEINNAYEMTKQFISGTDAPLFSDGLTALLNKVATLWYETPEKDRKLLHSLFEVYIKSQQSMADDFFVVVSLVLSEEQVTGIVIAGQLLFYFIVMTTILSVIGSLTFMFWMYRIVAFFWSIVRFLWRLCFPVAVPVSVPVKVIGTTPHPHGADSAPSSSMGHDILHSNSSPCNVDDFKSKNE
jgi:hypothetical protein